MSLRCAVDAGVLTLTIDRPERRNALTPDVWRALAAQLEMARREASVDVVVVTGVGEKAFAAGTDVSYLRQRSIADVLDGLAQEVYDAIERLPKPVIAAVNGAALGGGCELALACDIRIASTTACFGQPEVNLGIIPGAGGTQRLVRVVGLGWGKELLLTGRTIDAQEALRIGLVTRLAEPETLLDEARALAQELRKKGPLALALVKTTSQSALGGDRHTAMLLERFAQAVLTASADAREGLAAFLEKRPPIYRGA